MVAGGRRPTLEPILHGEIWAGESAQVAKRNTQRLCGERVILSEVLRDHDGAVARIAYGDRGVLWLSGDEGSQVVPLAGRFGVERIVDQDGQIQIFPMAPIRDLHAFFAFKNLHIFFFDRRWGALLSDGGDSKGRGIGSIRRGTCECGEREEGNGQEQRGFESAYVSVHEIPPFLRCLKVKNRIASVRFFGRGLLSS